MNLFSLLENNYVVIVINLSGALILLLKTKGKESIVKYKEQELLLLLLFLRIPWFVGAV